MFLYSQDLSNSKTIHWDNGIITSFLYSQDLSNSKTFMLVVTIKGCFCTLKI